MDNPQFERPQYTTYSYENPRKPKRNVRMIGVVLVVLGIALFGLHMVFGWFGGKDEPVIAITPTPTEFVFPTDAPTPTDTPSPTASPSATPKATSSLDKTTGLNRAALSVEVQNGSGEVGAASKMADFLKGLGYVVDKIGNASSFDFEGVTIEVDSKKATYLNLLKKDLSASYTVSSASATLSASSSADAVVIIGK